MELTSAELDALLKEAAEQGARTVLNEVLGSLDDAVRQSIRDIADEEIASVVNRTAETVEKTLVKTQTTLRKNEKKRHADKRLYNTRLLLKNYRMLKEHFQNAVYTFEEEVAAGEMKPGDIWKLLNRDAPSEEIYVEAICKSATRTMIIIEHLERMLGIYEAYCSMSHMDSMKRQCRVLQARYLEVPTVSMTDIAEREHVSLRTAERDLDAAIEGLTALIFGIDSIKDISSPESDITERGLPHEEN